MPDQSGLHVGVIGLGYVGLPLALALTNAEYTVTGVDIDQERVTRLSDGQSYIKDVSDEEIETARTDGFIPTTEYDALSDVDAVSICVPTPLRKSGQPDVSYVIEATENLAEVITEETVVVLESTVYPGATEEVVAAELASNGWTVGEDVYVAFSPERIDPGNEEYGVTDIPKIIGGVTEYCGDQATAVYMPVFDQVHRVSGSAEAEFVKLLENTFRNVNIGLINELALAADQMDIDIWESIEAAATKPFGYMPFYPGPGLGGHCIPVDPQHLSWKAKQQGFETRFVNLADHINRKMPKHVVNRIATVLNENGVPMLDAEILILGVAYKPDVSDTRESPALDIIDLLRDRGANISYHDPHVTEVAANDWTYNSVELTADTLEQQDMVVIVTDHSIFDIKQIVDHAPRVFDTRNATAEYKSHAHIERL